MRIHTKILGGFMLTTVLGLILGIVSILLTSQLTSGPRDLHGLQSEITDFTSILNAHYTWRNNLTETVLTGKEFTGSLDPTACALGKWMNSEVASKVTDSVILQHLSNVKAPHDFIHNEAKKVVDMIKTGDKDGAEDELINVILPKFADVVTELSGIMNRYGELIASKSGDIDRLGELSRFITAAITAAVLVASTLLSIFISNSVIKPVKKITAAAEKLAVGDLDIDTEYRVDDQIGRLAKSFQTLLETTKRQVAITEMLADGDLTADVKPRGEKDSMSFAIIKMLDNLNYMFSEIRESTSQVSMGAKQLADGSQVVAQGATEQAATIDELSNSIADISKRTRDSTATTDKTAKLSASIKAIAEKGNRQMDEMIKAVKDINDASNSIGKIIKTIDDIAFQTNILALNAAVEAARAGQHGKGFAVVAEEVRNLASKSAEAAKDTGAMIQNSMEKAQLGYRIAGETAASLKDIVSGINESSQLVTEIAGGSEEQAFDIEQIYLGIDQVSHVVSQNGATAEESAAASAIMCDQSDMLRNLITHFKLKGAASPDRLSLPARSSASHNH